MTKEVNVFVTGLHMENSARKGESGRIEMIYPGTCKKVNDTWYIKYEEPIEDSKEVNICLIKIRECSVEYSKRGEVSTQMIFEAGKKAQTYYDTPYMSMNISTMATRVKTRIKESVITAHVEYILTVGDSPVSDAVVDIKVVPKDKFSLEGGIQ